MSTQTSAESGPSSIAIETHSIEPIPAADRYGSPRSLFTLWFSANLTPGVISVGAACGLLGLPLIWTLIAAVLGHAIGGIFMALHSAQGPKLGIPQMIQSRAQFGYVGAVLPILAVVVLYVATLALYFVLLGGTLADITGMSGQLGMIIAAVLTGLLALYGYRLVHFAAKILSVAGGLVFLILTIGLFARNDVASTFEGGTFEWPAFLLVVGTCITFQLTYGPFVADYSRYLPEATSKTSVFWYTYLGNVGSALWMFAFGAIGVTIAVDGFSSGSTLFLAGQAGFGTEIFVIILLLGFLPQCALNAYGGFMSTATILNTVAPKIRITRWVRFVGVAVIVGIGLIMAMMGQADFLTNLLGLVVIIGALLIPWSMINIVDFYLVRREKYDIDAIFDRDGIYGSFDWRALTAYLVTVALAIPFINTYIYTGPFAAALGGLDISWIVCLVVSSVLYYALVKIWPVRRGVSAFTPREEALVG